MNCYELIEYRCGSTDRKESCEKYLQEVAAPAMNRAGVSRVGLFDPGEATSLYVLAVHASFAAFAENRGRLLEDTDYAGMPADPASIDPRNFDEAVSSIMLAFPGMPDIASPEPAPDRRYQLRIYESPTPEAGKRKIEMFHAGEMEIFRRVGLDAVFFAEALSGPRLPNLTYMLSFPDRDAQRAAWTAFVEDPEWKRLSGEAHYADAVIIRDIANIELTALPGSQI